jgi:hypothetical protein
VVAPVPEAEVVAAEPAAAARGEETRKSIAHR